MSVQSRIEKLEKQPGASAGVRCTIIVPPKMSRDEWQAHAREMNSKLEVVNEHTE
jgi:hypothetical protein